MTPHQNQCSQRTGRGLFSVGIDRRWIPALGLSGVVRQRWHTENKHEAHEEHRVWVLDLVSGVGIKPIHRVRSEGDPRRSISKGSHSGSGNPITSAAIAGERWRSPRHGERFSIQNQPNSVPLVQRVVRRIYDRRRLVVRSSHSIVPDLNCRGSIALSASTGVGYQPCDQQSGDWFRLIHDASTTRASIVLIGFQPWKLATDETRRNTDSCAIDP